MISIHELMTTHLHTLRLHHTLHDAHALMTEYKIRHIPVVDNDNKFVGLLSQRDLLAMSVSTFADISNAERDELEDGIPLSEVVTRDVIAAGEDTSLLEAARFMLNTKHGCLPVVDSQAHLKGILTEADFVRLAVYLLEKIEKIEQP